MPSLPVVAGVGQGGVGVGVVGVCVVNTDPRGLGQGVDILLQIRRLINTKYLGAFAADLEAVEVLDLGGGGVYRRLAHQH